MYDGTRGNPGRMMGIHEGMRGIHGGMIDVYDGMMGFVIWADQRLNHRLSERE